MKTGDFWVDVKYQYVVYESLSNTKFYFIVYARIFLFLAPYSK